MGQLDVISTPIQGLYILKPRVHGDARGYFCETYNVRDMAEKGLNMTFVQDNESLSVRGVLRGMHFQRQHPQGKLVRALRGSVYDAVVDLRPGSTTYGQAFGTVLSDENHCQLYVPPGFAHGYLTLSDVAVFSYKVTDFYHPEDEGGLRWNDPALGIAWPGVAGECLQDGTPLIINERDRNWPLL